MCLHLFDLAGGPGFPLFCPLESAAHSRVLQAAMPFREGKHGTHNPGLVSSLASSARAYAHS